VSTRDGSSPEVSRKCTVVPAELVSGQATCSKAAWTSPPSQVWKVTEWQIYVARPGGEVRPLLDQFGYMFKARSVMMDD